MLLIATNLAYGFVVDKGSAGTRIRNTRAFVATAPAKPLVEPVQEPAVSTTRNQYAIGKPKITSLESAEDYRNFLEEDDRLCMVK
jgi:hypothetical protein